MLAARLVAGRRAPEAALLVARGASRARLVGQAAAEAGALAVLAHRPGDGARARAVPGAGRRGRPRIPRASPRAGCCPLVASVTAVTLTLGALLVLPWLRTGTSRGTREDRVGVVARSGADLLLLALAALAYLQLRAHRIASGVTADPVLVVAPGAVPAGGRGARPAPAPAARPPRRRARRRRPAR